MIAKIRVDIIKSKIANIVDSINLVGENLSDNFQDFIGLGLFKEGIYKKIEFSIQNVIDICNVINSDLDLGIPEDEDGILDHLEHNDIFSKKIISIIREMKGFRNILVHKYGDIDDKRAFLNIKEGLEDFEKIINEIENFLEKNEKKG